MRALLISLVLSACGRADATKIGKHPETEVVYSGAPHPCDRPVFPQPEDDEEEDY